MIDKLSDSTTQLAFLKLNDSQLKVNTTAKVEDEKLKEQTDQFEALLVKTLLDVSMKDSNDFFGEDAGDKIYQSMFREEVSKLSAGGFGISQTLFNFLKDKR
jgi:Rod binding domain-containing protein